MDGAASRLKARVRWYGEVWGQIDRPALEFKIRDGLVSGKMAFTLPTLAVTGGFTREIFEAAFRWHSVPAEARLRLHALEPSLVTSYRRRYFRSADGAARLTLDSELRFLAPRNPGSLLPAPAPDRPNTILELKYAPVHATEAARIMDGFPFRMTRCSKYVLGIQCLNGA